MANIIEVDLDNAVVIEVQPDKKVSIVSAIGLAHGYSAMIPNSEQKEFTGTVAQCNTFVANLTEKQQLINVENNGKKVIYQDDTEIANPVSLYDFGLNSYKNYCFRHAGDCVAKVKRARLDKQLESSFIEAIQGLTIM